MNVDKKVRNRAFDCHLSPDWRQMAIENTVSIDFYPCSSIFQSVFVCTLSGVTTLSGFGLPIEMVFPTMWYVRPAKPHISLRIRAV